MSNFDPMNFIGPRFIDVMQSENSVLEARNVFYRNGIPEVVKPMEIGRLSGVAFNNDKTVRDIMGNKIGVLENSPNNSKYLRRW